MAIFGKHLRLLFLGTALVVAAFSTGLSFLFFLVYLSAAHPHRRLALRPPRAARRARRLPGPQPANARR